MIPPTKKQSVRVRLSLYVPVGLTLALLLFLWPGITARADIGPKPEMRFTFQFETGPLEIVQGRLLECEDAACRDARPLEELGPQRFTCTGQDCSSMAYSYAPYHQLEITFADGSTRLSNVFQKESFAAQYRVSVTPTGLQVTEQWSRPRLVAFCPAAILTLLVEVVLAWVYLLLFRRPKRVLIWVVVANLLSLPVVWLVFPLLPLSVTLGLALSELFAFLFEAVFLYLTNRRVLGLTHALALSLVLNLSSFLIGALFVGG